jgi:hypothetical protein
MLTNSVWLGDRQQGNHDIRLRGDKGITGFPPEVVGPRGRYLTGLVEPSGVLGCTGQRPVGRLYAVVHQVPESGDGCLAVPLSPLTWVW